MMSNLGNGKAMMTYANITNLETCTGLQVSQNAQRFLDGKASEHEKLPIAQAILEGVSHYIPKMKDAKIIDVKFGIVQTKGKLTLSDLQKPTHEFNTRSDHFIRSEQIGLISSPCMKLFYFVDNAQIVLSLIKKHINADRILHICLNNIKDQLSNEKIPFNKTKERAIKEYLERYESENISDKDIETIVKQTLKVIKQKSNMNNFFYNKEKNDATTQPADILKIYSYK